MIRLKRSLAAIALVSVTACGGGGGSSTVPSAPQKPSSGPAKATFSFRIPSKSTMIKLQRPAYISQATQGVAIDWASTDPTHPDFAAPVAAVCPNTLPAGVTACSIDAAGNTDYTFQLVINPGSYTFTVTSFDTPPAAGSPPSFSSSAHVLAQGQLASPVTIAAGQANTVPAMTFYGVPATVAFGPAPSQVHAIAFNSGFGIIGTGAQIFYAQSLDADGYAIGSSDPGAPVLSVSEASSDSPQLFSVSQINNYTFAVSIVASPAGVSGTLNAQAVAHGGGVSATASAAASVTPIPELWTTQAAGGSSTWYGLAGYAMFPPSYNPSGSPVDFIYDAPNALCGTGGVQCQFEPAAAQNGVIVAKAVQNSNLYEFAPPATSYSSGVLPKSALPYSSSSISNMAFDASGHLFVTDNAAGTLVELASPTTATPIVSTMQITGVSAVGIAPSVAAIPASLQQSIWTTDSSGNVIVFPAFSGSAFGTPITVTPSSIPGQANAIGFDVNGNLWILASGYVYAYTVSGSTSGITLTQLAAALTSSVNGSNFGVSPDGRMLMGDFGSYNYISAFSLTGCPTTCAISSLIVNSSIGAPVDAAMVVP